MTSASLGKLPWSRYCDFLWMCIKLMVLPILIILSFLLGLIFTPIFLLFTLPIYFYRLCQWLWVKCCCCCCAFSKDFGNMLDSHSVIFGVDSIYKDPYCVCVARFISEGQITDLQGITKSIEENWLKAKLPNGQLKYPELQQYVESYGGFLWWKKEPNFNIGNHVKFLERKNPGNFTTPKEVFETWNEMSMKPFDEFRSPWEIVIMPYYREPVKQSPLPAPPILTPPADVEKSVVIFRWHHCLADGYSMISLLAATSTINLNTVAKAKVHSSPPSCCRRFGNFLRIFFIGPYTLLSTLFRSADSNPWHLTEKKLTRYWHLGLTEKIPTETIYAIKQSCGLSFTTILLGCVCGAMRKLMIRDKELDPGKKIPRKITCGIPMALADRPASGLHNHWAMCTISLPVQEENPFKRLQIIEKGIQDIKSSCQPNISHLLTPFVGSLFASWVRVIAKNRMTTVVCSIMPGPPEVTKNFNGDKILDAMYINGCGPGRNGFTFSVLTFSGSVQFATIIDSAFSPNESIVSDVALAMEEELRFLRRSSNAKPFQV